MRKISVLGVLATCLFTTYSTATSQPATIANPENEVEERRKLSRIQEILRQQKLDLTGRPESFCPAFLDGLRANRDISVVAPTLKPRDTQDPIFDKYRACDPRKPTRDRLARAPGFDGAFEFITDFGHRDFRVYRFENAKKQGQSVNELIYGELDPAGPYSNQERAGYRIVDPRTCGYKHSVPVEQSLRIHEDRRVENYNIVLRFQDSLFVLDLYDYRGINQRTPRYMLKLYPLKLGQKAPSCVWS